MTTVSYKSRENETVDLIAWRYYGSTEDRIVERLLLHNPGLAGYGPVLPAGVRIKLPELPVPATKEGLSLWD